jgi:hypothetical protein
VRLTTDNDRDSQWYSCTTATYSNHPLLLLYSPKQVHWDPVSDNTLVCPYNLYRYHSLPYTSRKEKTANKSCLRDEKCSCSSLKHACYDGAAHALLLHNLRSLRWHWGTPQEWQLRQQLQPQPVSFSSLQQTLLLFSSLSPLFYLGERWAHKIFWPGIRTEGTWVFFRMACSNVQKKIQFFCQYFTRLHTSGWESDTSFLLIRSQLEIYIYYPCLIKYRWTSHHERRNFSWEIFSVRNSIRDFNELNISFLHLWGILMN